MCEAAYSKYIPEEVQQILTKIFVLGRDNFWYSQIFQQEVGLYHVHHWEAMNIMDVPK